MPKRKIVSESDKAPKKKLKSDSNATPKAFLSELSFDSSEQCLRSLIYPTTLEDFMAKYWEKEPLFVHRNNRGYFKEFPTGAKLEQIAKKEHLKWDKDLFVSQSENGTTTTHEAEGRATVKKIQKYLKEKLSVLLNKPHRFHGELYQLLLLLEEYFGCCIDCCLEISTEGAYGRKPGYIGKEEFILQIEGKKRWCLYKPIQKLPFLDSEDLSPDDIGEVTHEFVLEPGDLLYFPRGTVHQAHSVPGEVSTNISLELFEEHNWGHFLSSILEKAASEALEKDVAFREGLPVNFLRYMGYEKKEFKNDLNGNEKEQTNEVPQAIVPKIPTADLNSQKSFQDKLQKMLTSLGQYLDPHWGADLFYGKNFMAERLAPAGDEGKPSETEQTPTDESLIEMKHKKHVRIVHYDPGEEWNEDDESEDENMEEEQEDKEEATEKKKKSQKVSKNKAEKKSRESKTDAEEKDVADDEMASDEDELDESFEKKACVIVQHSLNNVLESDDEEEDLSEDDEDHRKESKNVKFPIHYRDALLIVHRTPAPVAVRSLPLTSKERVELAVTLWCEGLVTEVAKS